MKCALIMADSLTQIMLTPENDLERKALNLITPDKDISIDIKEGTLYDNVPPSAHGYLVQKCQGGYLRAYEQRDAVMLVLRPKPKKGGEE